MTLRMSPMMIEDIRAAVCDDYWVTDAVVDMLVDLGAVSVKECVDNYGTYNGGYEFSWPQGRFDAPWCSGKRITILNSMYINRLRAEIDKKLQNASRESQMFYAQSCRSSGIKRHRRQQSQIDRALNAQAKSVHRRH